MNGDEVKHLWKNELECQVKWDVGIQSGFVVQILEKKSGNSIPILATLFLSNYYYFFFFYKKGHSAILA